MPGRSLKTRVVGAGYSAGIFNLAARLAPSGRYLVLMYHRLGDSPEPFQTPVTIGDFEKQLNYLRSNYRIMPLTELAGSRRENARADSRRLAITFDDCFTDFHSRAFPLLKKFDIPATVFISTGFVDSDRVPWTDELNFLMKETAVSGISFGGKEGDVNFQWRDTAGRLEALEGIKRVLKRLPEEERAEIFQEVRERLAVSKKNPSRILTSDQIKEMSAAGVSFGAHTVNHVILTRVAPERARREIEDSKKQLEELAGAECAGFCYPNGEADDFNPEVRRMVEEAGCVYACTVLDGVNGPETDSYALRRLWTSERRLPFFAARLARTVVGL